MTLWRRLHQLAAVRRDVRAVWRGRVPQRLYNRAVSRLGWKLLRKVYR